MKREEINEEKQQKIEVFRTVYRDVVDRDDIDRPTVRIICQRFKADLSELENSIHEYHRTITFRKKFSDLYSKYQTLVDPSGK